MKVTKESMELYAVTDRSWLGDETLYSQVEKALKGGVTFLQLREKDLAEEDFFEEAKAIKKLCEKYKVPFIINDNVDIAIKVDADGVHVGQSDMEAGNVRAKLGPDKIIGVSARNVEQALKAQEAGADYLGIGAVFSTSTKLDANHVTYEEVQEITKNIDIPTVAIGGISEKNVLSLAGSGVDGIAVVSAIFAKDDITQAAVNLKQLTGEMLSK